MTKVSFEQGIYLVTPDSTLTLKIKKDGLNAANISVSTSGNSLRNSEKYPNRAIKDSNQRFGHFYSSTDNINWDEGDQSDRFYDVKIFPDKNNNLDKSFQVKLKSSDPNIQLENPVAYVFIINDKETFFSRYLKGRSSSMFGDSQANILPPYVERRTFNVRSVDPIGEVQPLSNLVVAYERNQFDFVLQQHLLFFSGAIKAKIYNSGNSKSTRKTDGEHFQPYNIFALEIPFTNKTSNPIPVKVKCFKAENFYRLYPDQLAFYTDSIRGYLGPNSNLIFFEFNSSMDSYWTSNIVFMNHQIPVIWLTLSCTALVQSLIPTNIFQYPPYEGHYWT